MKAGTIRQIHSILYAAFATAQRWEWIDRSPWARDTSRACDTSGNC